MNTIPIIFNERQIRRMVIGGTDKKITSSSPVTAVLLNNGGRHYRPRTLQNLMQCGFQSIISIEKAEGNYNLEEFSSQFPSVKFVVPLEDVTDGDMINIGMSEADTEYVLIVRDSIKITPKTLTSVMADRIQAAGRLCTVPMLVSPSLEMLPVRISPYLEKNALKFRSSVVMCDGCPTFYPFDFIGVYNRTKFIQMGGFDYTISSPYWQNLDFSFRSWLWGEEIVVMPSFRLVYEMPVPVENDTVEQSYLRFYLKNIAPRIRDDYAYIPVSKIFSYIRRSPDSIIDACRDFSNAREWVAHNKYRFKSDAVQTVSKWEKN